MADTKPVAENVLIYVLHVDDDFEFLEVSKQILAELNSNLIVDIAFGVDEALNKISKQNYDVIVSDYDMPQKNGLEFLEGLKEKAIDLPFILFTGKSREEIAINALNLGADGYFNKQGDPETVFGEIAHGIRKIVESDKRLKLLLNKDSEISALSQIPKTVLQNNEFLMSARQIFDICKQLVHATAGYVALLDSTNKNNTVLFLDSGNSPCTVDSSLPMPIRGLRAEAYSHSKVVYENDFVNSRWIDFVPKGHVILRNVMFAPITSGGKTVGVIGLANKEGGFNENDAILSSYFGEVTSIALMKSQAIGEIKTELIERKKAEQALLHKQRELQTIFDSSPTWIFYKDCQNSFIRVNNAFAKLMQKPKEQLEGHSLFELYPKEQAEKYWTDDKQVIASGKPKFGIIEQIQVNGRTLWTKTDKLPYCDLEGKIVGVIGFAVDITEQKERDLTLRRQTLRFKLEDGNIYRVEETSPMVSLEAFKDLQKIGFDASVISRTPEAEFKKLIGKDVSFHWLANQGKNHLKPKIETIKKVVETKQKNTVFLFDGLDYLNSILGAKKVLSLIQWLTEYVVRTNNIVLMPTDSSIFSPQERKLFEKETKQLEPMSPPISIELLGILQLIHSRNKVGINPSHNDIQLALNISRQTFGRKMKILKSKQYVVEDKIGNRRVLHLSESALNLLQK